jgi:hypothetical protein
MPSDIEGYFIELNLRRKKWVLFAGYNPNKDYITNFLKNISTSLNKHMSSYDNLILVGDFNSEMIENDMKEFCETYHLKNLIKEPTCFKNPHNPTSIDLILTNRINSFQHSDVIETGLSDFHKMTITVLKTYFQKQSPVRIKYRNYKKFDDTSFRNELLKKLDTINLEHITYDDFHTAFMSTLENHAPLKEKLVRANNAPFMNKELSKAIMKRSQLRNMYNKVPTNENLMVYKKQRNLCVKLSRKT